MTNHGTKADVLATDHKEFVLVLPRDRPRRFKRSGVEQREWLLRLPKGVNNYSWGDEGEEGSQYGPSIKSILSDIAN